jgi:hypothetical protein
MSHDPYEMGRVAVAEAEATIESSTPLLQSLGACSAGGAGTSEFAGFKLTPRHAIELHRYLEAHQQKLEEWCEKVGGFVAEGKVPPEPYVQLLVSRRFEFESAVRFVEEAFIKPRLESGEPLVLEVADWLCVDSFQLFVVANAKDPGNYPLGPLVALDSRRSPAMWKDDADLTIPSLFDLTARIHRSAESSTNGLAVFPVISLPADLSHLPEYYALLTHEVGHAVDAAFAFTTLILRDLGDTRHKDYWNAWMREIVADAAGVTLSGEAFALAWWRFVRPLSPKTDLTYSDPYPPVSLRLAFLRLMLESRGNLTPAIPAYLPIETPLKHQHYEELKDDFATAVRPLLEKFIFSAVPFPPDHESFTRNSAQQALRQEQVSWLQKEFRLLPSVLTQAITRESVFQTWKVLPDWLRDFRRQNEDNLPDWQSQKTSEWSFSRDFLPTLRPTILGPDGVTKTPPRVLLLTHDKIAFLGATQKWLLAALEETALLRDKPWEQIHVYFASDALLKSVEAHGKAGRRRRTSSLRKERKKALVGLKDFFRKHPSCCPAVCFYFFDGPPVFGSYWDWDQPGGRIHISAQLAGIDISKCPSIDYIWLQDTPTFTYDQYREYLLAINKRAKPIRLIR